MSRSTRKIFKLPNGVLFVLSILLLSSFVLVQSSIDDQELAGLPLIHLTNESLNENHNFGQIETVVKYDYYNFNGRNYQNRLFNDSIKRRLYQLKNGPFGLGVCIAFEDDCQYEKIVEYLDLYQLLSDSIGLVFNDTKYWFMKKQPAKYKKGIVFLPPVCGNPLLKDIQYNQKVEENLVQAKMLKFQSNLWALDAYLYCSIALIVLMIVISLIQLKKRGIYQN